MKNNLILIFLMFFILSSCAGTGSRGVFGTGVSIALDPRSLGTQIDDSIMQKNVATRLIMMNKNYILSIKTKVCLLYTSPSPRDLSTSRMPSSA